MRDFISTFCLVLAKYFVASDVAVGTSDRHENSLPETKIAYRPRLTREARQKEACKHHRLY